MTRLIIIASRLPGFPILNYQFSIGANFRKRKACDAYRLSGIPPFSRAAGSAEAGMVGLPGTRGHLQARISLDEGPLHAERHLSCIDPSNCPWMLPQRAAPCSRGSLGKESKDPTTVKPVSGMVRHRAELHRSTFPNWVQGARLNDLSQTCRRTGIVGKRPARWFGLKNESQILHVPASRPTV
jgi:hypothetical protein